MSRYVYAFILITLLGSTAVAQDKSESRIKELVIALNNAIIQTDSAALKLMVWDELSYGHSSGLLQDKTGFIARVMNGPNFFKQIDVRDQTVSVQGKTAIVRHIVTARVMNGGVPGELKFGNIMTWQKRHNQWRLLARQGYKVN